jgi:excinuclease ABC subunit A
MQKGFSRIYVSPFSHSQKENTGRAKAAIYRIEELLVAGRRENLKQHLNYPENVYVLIDRHRGKRI